MLVLHMYFRMLQILLPKTWLTSVRENDHLWMSRALFSRTGGGPPKLRPSLSMWVYPPQPQLVYNLPPASPAHFFAIPIFLWMPYRMWKVRLACPHEACEGRQLTACGLYKSVREVLDIDGYFYLATEYLECGNCHRKLAGWSTAVMDQLDIGHRCQFPAIVTYKYACSRRVLVLLKERSLGNSVGQLVRKLCEEHSEAWLDKVAHYLTACESFLGHDDCQQLGIRPDFQRPPPMPALPRYKWLLSVYVRDVLQRLDEVKARITSTYGSVLKMDSTKKVHILSPF